MTNPFSFIGPCSKISMISRHKMAKKILNHLKRFEYVSVLAPPQTGKSTFFNNDLQAVLGNNYVICRLDLADVNENSLITMFDRAWQRRLGQEETHQPDQDSSSSQTINTWLEGHEVKQQVIYLIDELPRDTAVTTVLLSNIRTYYHEAISRNNQVKNLFIFASSDDLAFLPRRVNQFNSPFNIAHEVYLNDFSANETRELICNLVRNSNRSHLFDDKIISRIFNLTLGHPYLVQLLCSRIYDAKNMDIRNQILVSAEQAVQLCEIEDQINVQTMMDRLTDIEGMKKERILLKELIIGTKRFPFTPSVHSHKNLQLQGCIRDEDGYCQVRNPIYEVVFRRFFDAEIALTTSIPTLDGSMSPSQRKIRPFMGLLYIKIMDSQGAIKPDNPEEPCFTLKPEQEYHLTGSLIEGDESGSYDEYMTEPGIKLSIDIPGEDERDRPVEYQLIPDSITVDYSPRKATLGFTGVESGGERSRYFNFRFVTPPIPAPEVTSSSFRIFMKIFQGSNVVYIGELQLRLSN